MVVVSESQARFTGFPPLHAVEYRDIVTQTYGDQMVFRLRNERKTIIAVKILQPAPKWRQPKNLRRGLVGLHKKAFVAIHFS